MKKRGNISFVAFAALIVVCCGAALLTVASGSKYNAKKEYQRMEERYIAESGIDTATGLFLSYLSNRDLVLAYTKSEDGVLSVIDEFVPYLADEIKYSDDEDVQIKIVENEARDYLAGIGFLDYIRDESIQLCINTFGNKEGLKLSEMCTEYDFLLSLPGDDNDENRRSRLKPIYLTVKSKYLGGEVTASIKISNLYAEREAFPDIGEGETGSVIAFIDTDNAEIEFENYQNYRSVG